MKVALVMAFLFYLGSSFGWVLELFYRRIISTKWMNPGFLAGPYLPIYGVGLCMLFLLSLVDLSFIGDTILQYGLTIIFMGLIMTFIEFITGIIFIKGLGVKLWDYSNRWGNIQGIICPLYTFFWCILGAIYYFFIQSHMIEAVIWFSNNLAFSFVIGFFFGILTMDIINSMNIVVKLKEFAKENHMIVRFEELKNHIREEQEKRKEKFSYWFAFKTSTKLIDNLNAYKKKYFSKNTTKEEGIDMKNQNGITLMILVVAVTIIAIIAGSISYNSVNSYKMNSYYSMCSDIELLDEKIAIYYLEHKDTEDETFGLPIQTSESIHLDDLVPNGSVADNVNYNPNNSGILYKINLSLLENLTLNSTDYYIDRASHTIYAKKGVTLGNDEYYTVPLHYDDVRSY